MKMLLLSHLVRRWLVPVEEVETLLAEMERVRRENYTLRDALREANAELFRHRQLLASLRRGEEEATAAVEKALKR